MEDSAGAVVVVEDSAGAVVVEDSAGAVVVEDSAGVVVEVLLVEEVVVCSAWFCISLFVLQDNKIRKTRIVRNFTI